MTPVWNAQSVCSAGTPKVRMAAVSVKKALDRSAMIQLTLD
jgi:hypothetical protein